MDFEAELRKLELVPIRLIGRDALRCVHLVYNIQYGTVAAKIFQSEKCDQKEFDAAFHLFIDKGVNQFVLQYLQLREGVHNKTILMQYANLGSLDSIVKQPQIQLPTNMLRVIMRQTLQGIKFIHNSGLVHRNIKSNNILLHSPPGSGRVYAKISDFGFAKKEDPETGVKFLEGF
ncbi:MAG: hypothetical protein EZS28_040535 [Streblomastix strix]|uniref:non-specific serine/threonine protein kinase n=1 Tax=Streblomastix strix TaxID=222440 RepID=A0A5J4U0Q7_9EUKA|nr:MAG: hypothetical protein EZS28_040535 [Streblomastix strix]